jgi:hypothetical protein
LVVGLFRGNGRQTGNSGANPGRPRRCDWAQEECLLFSPLSPLPPERKGASGDEKARALLARKSEDLPTPDGSCPASGGALLQENPGFPIARSTMPPTPANGVQAAVAWLRGFAPGRSRG